MKVPVLRPPVLLPPFLVTLPVEPDKNTRAHPSLNLFRCSCLFQMLAFPSWTSAIISGWEIILMLWVLEARPFSKSVPVLRPAHCIFRFVCMARSEIGIRPPQIESKMHIGRCG